MKKLIIAAAALALLAGAADAQPRNNNRDQHQQNQHDNDRPGMNNNGYRQHSDWRKGTRLSHNDWNRGQRVNYRTRHLKAPPRGYEYREVDGNLILGAVATGVIFSILANQ
jgi:Ni/Co efflux regulator RcnB